MDLGIEGDAALVAASSSGLGRASAAALAAEGVDVALNGRDADRLDEAVEAVRAVAADGARVVGHVGDLTDPDVPAALVEATVDAFGGLNHLVTNAGGPPGGPFLDTTDEQWYDAFDLLVMSAVRLIREAAPYLRAEGGGSVVTIASLSVKEAVDDLVLSNAVRASVVGLEKTLSRELAPEVRVNAILPGAHETDRIESLLEDAVERGAYDSYEAGYEDWAGDVPVGHVGDPGRFGRLVAVLCSDVARFVNGTTLVVDGGAGRATL